MPWNRPHRRGRDHGQPRETGGFSWPLVDTTTRMSLGGESGCALWRYTSYSVALLGAQPVQLVGDLGGGGIDGEQAFQFLDRQVGLAGLGVDLGQVLGGGAVA